MFFLPAILVILTMVGAPKPTPVPAPATKHVGLVVKGSKPICMGGFLTLSFLATSCRCIGTTDMKSGVFTRIEPKDYKVQSWGAGQDISKEASKFHYHPLCGLERNRVLMDIGLIEVSSAFPQESVQPFDIPSLGMFRFYKYIFQLILNEKNCYTSSISKSKGTTMDIQIRHASKCDYRPVCGKEDKRKQCMLPTMSSNHICAVGEKNCTESPGAPLMCHNMLVGINGRGPECDDVFNPSLFIRMDSALNWLMTVIC